MTIQMFVFLAEVKYFEYRHQWWYNQMYGVYSVMVSTRVCGTCSVGSNPARHPGLVYNNIIKWKSL